MKSCHQSPYCNAGLLERGNPDAAYLISSSAADSSEGNPLGFSLRTKTLAFLIATALSIFSAGNRMSIPSLPLPLDLTLKYSVVMLHDAGSAPTPANAV